MKKHLALTVLILIVLSLFVSCGEDPFFHSITIKNDGETLGTETVRNGSKYTLPKEYKGIENLSGWTIDDDETVYDPGQEITVTKDITINAYTVQPYFDYEDLGEDYNGWMVTLKDEYLETVTDVVIPSTYEGKKVIDVRGFNDAVKLTSVTIPSTVQSIYFAFDNCPKLEKVIFKADSQLEGILGFSNCTSLKSIVIPKSVTILGDGSFYNCTSLESVTFEDGSLLRGLAGGCFGNSKITSITLPEGLGYIGSGCFSGCSNLTTVYLPNSVYEISHSAFSNLNENATITIDRVKDSILDDKADKWVSTYVNSDSWSGKKTTYTITYEPKGATGESITTEAVDFGTDVTIEDCPSGWVKDGCTFDGWHTDSTGRDGYGKKFEAGTKYYGPTITLYAQWKASSES